MTKLRRRLKGIERRLYTVENCQMQDGVAMADLHARVSDLERGKPPAKPQPPSDFEATPKRWCLQCKSCDADQPVGHKCARHPNQCVNLTAPTSCRDWESGMSQPPVDDSCAACHAARVKLHPSIHPRCLCTGTVGGSRGEYNCRSYRKSDNLPPLRKEPECEPPPAERMLRYETYNAVSGQRWYHQVTLEDAEKVMAARPKTLVAALFTEIRELRESNENALTCRRDAFAEVERVQVTLGKLKTENEELKAKILRDLHNAAYPPDPCAGCEPRTWLTPCPKIGGLARRRQSSDCDKLRKWIGKEPVATPDGG